MNEQPFVYLDVAEASDNQKHSELKDQDFTRLASAHPSDFKI